jgi:hypothetical protein
MMNATGPIGHVSPGLLILVGGMAALGHALQLPTGQGVASSTCCVAAARGQAIN